MRPQRIFPWLGSTTGVAMALVTACASLDSESPPHPSDAGDLDARNAGGGPSYGGAAGSRATSGGGANLGGATSSGGSSNIAGTSGAGGAADGAAPTADDAAIGDAGRDGEASAGTPGDGSVTDATRMGDASSTCVTAGTELCEDFESGQIDLQKWKITKPTASASIVVDETRPHTGRYALHVKVVPGQTSTAQIADAVTFPAASNTFYTRAFVYFSPDLPADNNGGFHMAYLLATGNNDLGFVEAGLGSSGNKNYLGYSEYYGSGPNNHAHGPTFTEFGPRSPLQVVPMKWLCLELLQGGDATTTTRRIWVDGTELTEQVSNYTGRKPPQFELVSIGVLQYHPTPVLSDVWFDDIKVSKQRIGCNL